MNNRFLKLLNIHQDEAGIAGKLFTLQFFLIAGSSFLFVTANAIFLSALPISHLPFAFFITGIFLFFFNKIYHKAERLLSGKRLLRVIILFSIVITGLLGLFMQDISATWEPYLLLVWYNIVYLLTGLIFWGMAAAVFNVRESRRLFTIIGAGDIPAKILGYLSVSLLAPLIGLPNMIWASVFFFAVALWLSGRLFKHKRTQLLTHHHEADKEVDGKKEGKQRQGNQLIIAIALLSFISFATLILIDFVFLAEVKTRYHTDLELAYFLGLFFAGGRIFAVFIKFLLSSRFINYAGLSRSLLLSPVLLIIFTGCIFATYYYFPEFRYLIYLYGVMALLTEILKATIQEPVFLILFQPLKLAQRLKGHIYAKGYMLAASLTVVGGLLYLFLKITSITNGVSLMYVLLAMLGVWIFSVFLVKRQYVQNLHSALRRGYLSGKEIFMDDKATQELLMQKTESDNPAEVIFALDMLGKANYMEMDGLYERVLSRGEPILTDFVLERIVQGGLARFLPTLEEALKTENDAELSAKYIQAIARLDHAHPILYPYAESHQTTCRNAAIAGLLMSREEKAQTLARGKLEALVQSNHSSDRVSAAKIIGSTWQPKPASILKRLLEDEEEIVVLSAIEAAAQIGSKELIPALHALLSNRRLRKEAIHALSEMQDDAIHFFQQCGDRDREKEYILIAGDIPTEKATHYLLDKLFKEKKYGSLVITELRQRHYAAEGLERGKILAMIHGSLSEAAEIAKMKIVFRKPHYSSRCIKALDDEIRNRVQDSMKLIAMAFPQMKVKQAISVLLKQHHQSSNALEMLEISIPRDIFQMLIKVTEREEQLGTARNKDDVKEILGRIIAGQPVYFNDWTRAMVLQWEPVRQVASLRTYLEEEQPNFSPLLKEASSWLYETKNV